MQARSIPGGMTEAAFEKCANLLCVDSGMYTVDVEAQTFKHGTDNAHAEISANLHERHVLRLVGMRIEVVDSMRHY